MNLGAAWIYGAGPENPIRHLVDKLDLTVMTTPYLCCQELYKPDETLCTKDEYFKGMSQFYQVLEGILNASRTYEEDLSVYDAIKVTIRFVNKETIAKVTYSLITKVTCTQVRVIVPNISLV